MNQNIWGSPLWFSLHTITMNYPNKPNYIQKQDYKNFFISLQYVIPCTVCRKNYQRHLKELPIEPALESRKKLVYWLIDIHNMVNAEIGKKIMSYENIIDKYEKIHDKKIFDEECQEIINSNNQNHQYLIILLVIIIFIILFVLIYLFIKNKKIK
jgi:predicted nucleic acid-binding Zn ribbon protein